MKKNNKIITIKTNNNLESRQEVMDNQGFTVYPVIMMNEGVHNDVLYTLAELSKFYDAWNGVPVPVQHPTEEGVPVSANAPQIYSDQVVGTIFNTHIDGNALKAEIWLNNNKLNELAPEVRDFLQNGGQMDVSTGLFCDDVYQEGIFNGEEFVSIATNIRPDHLALLPGVEGACSWEDGCGVRANKNKKNNQNKGDKGGKMIRGNKDNKGKKEGKNDGDFVKVNDQYFIPLTESEIKTHKDDYTQIIDYLYDAVNVMDIRDQKYHYVSKVYSTYAIYRVNYIRSNEPSKFMKRDYTINEGVVEWTSEPVEVIRKVTYKEKTKTNNSKKEKDGMKTMKECCPDKVEELIKNNSNFTDDHRDVLLGMSEDAFELTINSAKPAESKEPKEPKKEEKEVDHAPKTNSKDPKDPEKMTFDELLANADPEARESIEMGKRMLVNKKKDLVEVIKANETNQFSDEELNGFGLDMLEKIAGSIPQSKTKVNDYSLNHPASVQTNDSDAPDPLPDSGNDWEQAEK